MSEIKQQGKLTKTPSFALTTATTEEKNAALEAISEQLPLDQNTIPEALQKHIEHVNANGITEAVLDRIMLDEKRIKAMANAVHMLINLTDPTGEVMETIEKDNGLLIQKKRVPIGVIGMIYEARPNVTIDAATLALKTGNAV